MRMNIASGVGVNLKAVVGLQLVLVVATAGFVAFLYGEVGPLLQQRAELQAGVDALRAETASLQVGRETLQTEKRALEAERDRLRSEVARLNADRSLLSASVRTLSSGSDRAVEAVESAAAATAERGPLSPRVYVHVASEASAQRAGTLVKNLEDAGFIVPSVERVRAVPAKPQLRFFSAGDKKTAQHAFDIVRRVIPGLELRSFEPSDVPGVRRQALRPGHLELWF
jgi:cell division protein FtsB